MPTQPILDFNTRVPTRREANHARLAKLRSSMYAWRSDAGQTTFDPVSGARRPQRHLYTPQPTQHFRQVQHDRLSGDAGERAPGEKADRCKHSWKAGAEKDGSTGSSKSGGHDKVVEQLCGGGETIWASAESSTGDRRRWWRQTNFTFSADYFGSRDGIPVVASCADGGSSTSRPHTRTPSPSVYTPYIHDTIVFCTPAQRAHTAGAARVVLAVTCNAAEARARECRAAAEATNGDMLSLSSLSPVPRVPPSKRTPYTYAPSPKHCFEENSEGVTRSSAAAAAPPGGMHSSITGAPYTDVEDTGRPPTVSLDDVMSTLGDTKLKPDNGIAATASGGLRSSKMTTATWCDAVGPTIASKQRALAMAEAVYSDLVAGEAQRTGSAYGSAASLRMATVPTCELAYSLRSSYMQASCQTQRSQNTGSASPHCRLHRRPSNTITYTSVNNLPRSATCTTGSLPSRIVAAASSSAIGRSGGPAGVLPVPQGNSAAAQRPSRQRPASASCCSSLRSRGNPHRRSTTEAGADGFPGSSLREDDEGGAAAAAATITSTAATSAAAAEVSLEEHHPDSRGASASSAPLPSLGQGCELPAATVSAATTAGSTNGGILRPSPPPPLTLQVDKEGSLTSSSGAAASQTRRIMSPFGGADGVKSASAQPTAPPTLSRFELVQEMMDDDASSSSALHCNVSSGGGGRRTDGGGVAAASSGSATLAHRSSHSKDSPLVLMASSRGARQSSRFTVSSASDTVYERQTIAAGDSQLCATTTAVAHDRPQHEPRRRRGRRLPPQQQTLMHGRDAGAGEHAAATAAARSRSSRRGNGSCRPRSREYGGAAAQPSPSQHHRHQRDFQGKGRLPAEAKETRVYAVRVRATVAAASSVWREPPRRGVPVLIPEEWQ
jgi:hypothetical protein